jgi:hypothetical protein
VAAKALVDNPDQVQVRAVEAPMLYSATDAPLKNQAVGLTA